jgi:hypothetical protein
MTIHIIVLASVTSPNFCIGNGDCNFEATVRLSEGSVEAVGGVPEEAS